jgi:hypothetical protein
MLIPSTTGRGLVNLVAEIEARLTGSARSGRLDSDLAARLPEGESVVLALFDGLGADQVIDEPDIRSCMVDVLHAPFPTTTTVSLATVATGRVASGHGVIGHLMWLPRAGLVANVLKFISPDGRPTGLATTEFLPGPTLWERLRAAGVEPVTVQPGAFADTSLSRALYRGCRFEPVWSKSEWIDATVQLAARPGRLVFSYWPDVDVAAHVSGRASSAYRRAVTDAGRLWQRLRDGVTCPLIGTSDHGHLDYSAAGKLLLRSSRMGEVTWFGDPRSLMARGDAALVGELLADTGARLFTRDEFLPWFGEDPDPHPEFDDRLPHVVCLAADDTLLLPRGFDRRLIGYHGGLRSEEVEIPLLVG